MCNILKLSINTNGISKIHSIKIRKHYKHKELKDEDRGEEKKVFVYVLSANIKFMLCLCNIINT